MPDTLSIKDIVFDKAKWHITKEFPADLDQYQSYVHTGFYVYWLIECDLYEQDFRRENIKAISELSNRQISPARFYEEQLDGVFDSEGLTQKAIKFTLNYFDFEKGQYIADYCATLNPDDKLASIFHVEDSWKSYDKLTRVLDRRFEDWNQTNREA